MYRLLSGVVAIMVLLSVIAYGTASYAAEKDGEKVADRFRLNVAVMTGKRKHADTDMHVYIRINGLLHKQIELDTPNHNDREKGAIDYYKNIKVNFPLKDVTHIELVAAGQNAWFLEQIEFQFLQGKKKSKTYRFKPECWLSNDEKDKRKMDALETLTFKMKPEVD